MNTTADRLIPPDEILADYAVTAEQFAAHGPGFVYEVLVKRGNLQPNDRVLDLGCGPGHHARTLTEYLSDDGSFDGLDIGKSVIDYCQAAYAHYRNFTFRHANIFNEHYNPTATLRQVDYQLPYPSGHFDFVYSVSLFTHLLPEDALAYFREIRRVMKPSGRFISSFFLLTPEALSNIANPARAAAYRFPNEYGCCRVMSQEDPAQAIAYPEHWIRESLHKSGLRVAETMLGTWNGERDRLQTLQDIVLAVPVG